MFLPVITMWSWVIAVNTVRNSGNGKMVEERFMYLSLLWRVTGWKLWLAHSPFMLKQPERLSVTPRCPLKPHQKRVTWGAGCYFWALPGLNSHRLILKALCLQIGRWQKGSGPCSSQMMMSPCHPLTSDSLLCDIRPWITVTCQSLW